MRIWRFTDYWRRPELPFRPFRPRFRVSERRLAALIEFCSGNACSLIPRP
jgi:hypothetical protein